MIHVKVDWNGPKIEAMLHEGMRQSVDEVGKYIEKTAKASMKEGYNGLRRSQPGEPPYKQTYNLYKNIKRKTRLNKDGASCKIGTNVKYGLDLELGVPLRHLARRPWLVPAFMKNIKHVYKIFKYNKLFRAISLSHALDISAPRLK